MEHTIKQNLLEIVSLKQPEEIKSFVETIITNEFTQQQYNDLMCTMLNDFTEHMKEEQKYVFMRHKIEDVIEYIKKQ